MTGARIGAVAVVAVLLVLIALGCAVMTGAIG